MKLWASVDDVDAAVRALENAMSGLGHIPASLARAVQKNIEHGYGALVERFFAEVDPLLLAKMREALAEK